MTEKLQKLDSQAQSIEGELQHMGETMHAQDDKIEATSTAIAGLHTQSGGLAQRMSAQEKEFRSKFQDMNLKVKKQADSIDQGQLILGALQEQQRNTAARTGYQANKIQALEVGEREINKEIGSLQLEMKSITKTQDNIQGDVLDISSQLVSFTRQLSSTVVDVEEVKLSLQTQGNDNNYTKAGGTFDFY